MSFLLIHGLGQTPSSWDKVVCSMPPSSPAHCPDLPLLLLDEECTYPNLFHAFSEYCNSFSAPLHLCGLSLGAVLALHYAIKNPGKVGSLVLIAPQYKMPQKLLQLQNVIFRCMPKSAFQGLGFDKWNFIKLTDSMSRLDFTEHLDITCPLLILCGEKDYANKRACVQLVSQLPHATFQLVEKAGHEVNKDAPEALATILNHFYAKLL